MDQPALATSTPAPFPRRAFDWWLAQVKHVLPPTIFFFVGFNLILWTKRPILEEHGVEFGGFLTATVAALLVGKAVLVTDNLPFMRRFDGAPLIMAASGWGSILPAMWSFMVAARERGLGTVWTTVHLVNGGDRQVAGYRISHAGTKSKARGNRPSRRELHPDAANGG